MEKKVITTALLLQFFAQGMFAQKMADKNIPGPVKSSIHKEYPSITKFKWEKENENYEAGFTMNKVRHSVVLNANGNILERETEIAPSALPASVLSYVKEHYPGKKATELAKITDAKNEVTYEVEMKGMDLLFDSKGNFIKALKD